MLFTAPVLLDINITHRNTISACVILKCLQYLIKHKNRQLCHKYVRFSCNFIFNQQQGYAECGSEQTLQYHIVQVQRKKNVKPNSSLNFFFFFNLAITCALCRHISLNCPITLICTVKFMQQCSLHFLTKILFAVQCQISD